MSRSPIRARLFAGVLAAALGAPGLLVAQEATPDPVLSDHVQAAVERLGLTEVEPRIRGDRPVRELRGLLPGGERVEVELDGNGQIEEIEARGPDRFPIASIEALVPDAVRANPNFPADAVLDEAKINDDGRVEFEGFLADGRKFDAKFNEAGELVELDIDD